MENVNFEIGEQVSIKIGSKDEVGVRETKKDYYFIWDIVEISNEKWVIVNINEDEKDFKNLLPKNDYPLYNLFNGLSYVKIKPYNLLKISKPEFLKFYLDEIKLLINERMSLANEGPVLFLSYIERIKDTKCLRDKLLPHINDKIFGNKFSTLIRSSDVGTNHNEVSAISQDINENLKRMFLINLNLLFSVKELMDIIKIMIKIKTQDGRNMYQKGKEDLALGESLYNLYQHWNDFSKGSYSPTNTSKNKPIVFGINQSYIETIEPKSLSYKETLEFNQSRINMYKSIFDCFNSVDFLGLIMKLEETAFRKFKKALLSGFADSIPIEKLVNGKKSIDYSLELVIPIFQHIEPEIFHEKGNRNENIRKIKNFLSGK